jgi:hypothetical protein
MNKTAVKSPIIFDKKTFHKPKSPIPSVEETASCLNTKHLPAGETSIAKSTNYSRPKSSDENGKLTEAIFKVMPSLTRQTTPVILSRDKCEILTVKKSILKGSMDTSPSPVIALRAIHISNASNDRATSPFPVINLLKSRE